MTDQQLETIVAIITGMQVSIVHLANVVATATDTDSDAIAASFEATAEAVPATAKNRELLQLTLRQVASGIRGNQTDPQWGQLLSTLLH